MKYQKGSFITVPNTNGLAGLNPNAQCLFMWLCYHANQDGTCFPSRKRLADLCGFSVDTVDRMTKLLVEKNMLIKTLRKKDQKVNQTNFYEVLVEGVASQCGEVTADSGEVVASQCGGELNSSLLTKQRELAPATPAQKAHRFFNDLDTQERLCKAVSEKYGIDQETIRAEIKKFIACWTEPNSTGKKQRWQMQKTFELTRRLSTWFSRSSMATARKDKSKTIIGL